MNLEKLKDAARKHEQREDWRKAIDAYQRVIQHFDSGREADADLTIYNRVGDLYLKLNDPGSAVQSYERAAELYGEQGFLNNAIALCGKVLRVNPGRVQVYLQLAHLHARKTVVSEAKRNLIEYMERMNTLGKLDEAFSQVKVFADQHSANQDIRLMLVELLRAASRTEEAQEQLERIASELEARGDRAGARKTRERIHAIDSQDEDAPAGKNDLIFLETGFEPPRSSRRSAADAEAEPVPPPAPVEGLETVGGGAAPIEGLQSVGGGAAPEAASIAPIPVAGLDTFEPPPIEAGSVDAGPLADLQPASFDASSEQDEVAQLDGLVLDHPDEEESFPSLDVAPEQGLDAEPMIMASQAEIHLESTLNDEPSSLDAALAPVDEDELVSLDDDSPGDDAFTGSVQFVDDFDVGSPIELQSRRGETDDLVEEEEPMLPSESAAAEAGPAIVWQEEPEAPDESLRPVPEPAPSEPSQLEVAELEDRILDDPDSAELHRALGDRLAEVGDLGRAVEEYLLGIAAFERDEAWLPALDTVDALLTLEPDAIRNQQKRVELAYRSGNRSRLLGAYLGLAEALVRAEALDKAVAVYQRVLEHDPDNQAARDAVAWLQSMSKPAEAEPVNPPPLPRSEPRADEPSSAARAATPPTPPSSGDFVDFGSMVIDAAGPRDTRMRIDGERPTGDEQKDFQETLEQFKRGIEANLGTEDFEAHYDLGVAFKEMGLLDEAIAEFQKALRAPNGRLRTSEALGVTFFEKEQYAIAETILRRAVDTLEGGDDEKIGLLYWLGRACESQGKRAEARLAFERALAVDIRFMDLNERIQKLAIGRSA